MRTEIKQHVILTQDRIINGKKVEHGRVIKNEGWITSSCGLVLSNHPIVDPNALWEEVMKIVEEGEAHYIYSHIDHLEEGEKPKTCKGCPNQHFTGAYFDYLNGDKNSQKFEWRMNCIAKGLSNWKDEKVKENAIRKHYNEGTKPTDCPI